MDEVIRAISDFVTGDLADLLLAIAILVVGWIAADIVARTLRAVLTRTPLDARVGGALDADRKQPLPLSAGIAEVARWLVVVFALLLFADTLGVEVYGDPLSALLSEALTALPRIAAALCILALGFVVATVLRRVVSHVFGQSKIAERIDQAADDGPPLAESLGGGAHGLTLLLALLLALDVLRMESVVRPLHGPAYQVVLFLPRLFATAAILGGGWVLAVIVRRGVTAVLGALGVDDVGRQAGVARAGIGSLSTLCGTLAFVLVLLPVLTAALHALGMEGVAASAGRVLDEVLAAIPPLLHAGIVVVVGVVIGGLLGEFAGGLLARIGLDGFLARIGLDRAGGDLPDARRPAAVGGQIVRLAVLVLAGAEALRIVGLGRAAELAVATCLRAGDWLLGLIVIGLGLWLSRALSEAVRGHDTPASPFLAVATRVSIAALAFVAGLEQMGLATWAVHGGFVAAFSGLALGAALAFGLGGSRHAGDVLRAWRRTAGRRE